MITEEINIKKVTPQKGYLLTNGETITDVIFMNMSEPIDSWWEIPDDNRIPEFDGSTSLYPLTWESEMQIDKGLWYTDGINTLEAIKNGNPISFEDSEYFNII